MCVLETIPVSSLWQYSGKTGIFHELLHKCVRREGVLKVGKPGFFKSMALNILCTRNCFFATYTEPLTKKKKKKEESDNTL